MLSYEQAINCILKNAHILPFQKVPIEDSVGRVLNEDIHSKIEMPPFDKSAMDGYAVNSEGIKTCPLKLKCLGIIEAGEIFSKRPKKGECVKIMTGAALPKNTDSIVMIENTRQAKGYVEILKKVTKGENVCFRGEDLNPREKVLGKGTKILSSHVGILATVGRRFVKVTGIPRVVVLNTGAEIVPIGNRLTKNKIYNSNGPMLCALLKSEGITPKFLGIAKDTVSELKKAITEGLRFDMFLISGGVSMGDFDLVPDVLRTLGVKKIFHKLNIKPGKPLFFGRKNKTLVFGIPGNPVSNFLSYLIFIRPALNKMAGCRNFKPEFKEGILEAGFHSKAGRKHFVLVKIAKKEENFYLTPVESHGSADVAALSKADGFMVIEQDTSYVKKKSKIKFITWKIL